MDHQHRKRDVKERDKVEIARVKEPVVEKARQVLVVPKQQDVVKETAESSSGKKKINLRTILDESKDTKKNLSDLKK